MSTFLKGKTISEGSKTVKGFVWDHILTDDISEDAVDAKVHGLWRVAPNPQIIQPDSLTGLVLMNGLYVPQELSTMMSFLNPVYNKIWKNLSFQMSLGPQVWINPVARGVTERCKLPEPPELPVRESDVPMVGYRVWDVETSEYGWFLESPSEGTMWEGPVMRANGKPCAYDPHRWEWRAKEDHCHGIYAHDKPEWGEYDFSSETAMGRIEMTGRVVVHEHGFRCEVARIMALVLHPSLMANNGILKALADRYQCNVSFDPTTLEG